MNKRDKKYIKKLEAYNLQAESRVKYALDRFDILIISLSSGGLILCLGIYEKFPQIHKELVNYAWSLFSTAIVLNLFSHITGYRANKLDINCTKTIIEEIKGKELPDTHKKTDKEKKIYHNATSTLNVISLVSLISAIIILIIFVNTKNLQNMSDKDKNKNGRQGEQRSSNNNSERTTGKSETGRLNESDSWGKIDKKGQGAGDRPKRDK